LDALELRTRDVLSVLIAVNLWLVVDNDNVQSQVHTYAAPNTTIGRVPPFRRHQQTDLVSSTIS